MQIITGADVVSEARSWVGTPFHDGQGLKGVGTDCAGMPVSIGMCLGFREAMECSVDPRFIGRSMHPNPKILLALCDSYLDRVQPADMQLGDLVLGKVEIEPQHFGIISCMNPLRMIHAYKQVRRVTENILDAAWRARLLRVYRFRGVRS